MRFATWEGEKVKLLTDNEEELEDVNEAYKNLPDSVKKFMGDLVVGFMRNKFVDIEESESPIEQLLGLALSQHLPVYLDKYADDYFVLQQEKIKCGEVKYRVDFMVAILNDKKQKFFVIECDGHDFHNKTKEQVKRDKKRDRNMLSNGYKVIRFTGSEIFNNPRKCAREVGEIILNDIRSERGRQQ